MSLRRMVAGVVAVALAAAGSVAVVPAPALAAPTTGPTLPPPCTQSAVGAPVECLYLPTSFEQSFVVPAGVTSLKIEAVGAPGRTGAWFYTYDPVSVGGRGARVTATRSVTPGSTVYIEVGTTRQSWEREPFQSGGVHGGGGATDLRSVSISAGAAASLASRWLVAGGGGGAGNNSVPTDHCFRQDSEGRQVTLRGGAGGDAGAPDGSGYPGQAAEDCPGPGKPGGAGGDGATTTAGGSGPSTPGSLGAGGDPPYATSGGGGGAGLYGGAAGGDGTWPAGGGGGGGGSSLVPPDGTIEVAPRGWSSLVTITYTPQTTVAGLAVTADVSRIAARSTFGVHAYTVGADGALLEDVTDRTSFSGDSLSCTGATCSFGVIGSHDVDGHFGSLPVLRSPTIDVTKAEQEFTFAHENGPSGSALEMSDRVTVSNTSGLPITLTIDTPDHACKVGEDGLSVIPLGPGTCSVSASSPGDDTLWLPTVREVGFTVYYDHETATYDGATSGPVSSSLPLLAHSRSGAPVGFAVVPERSSPSDACVILGNSVGLLKAGVCAIAMTVQGTYGVSYKGVVLITIGPRAQGITFPAPATATVGSTAPLTATSTSGLPVSFAVDPSTSPAGACTVTGSTVTFVANGTCVLVASQPGDVSFDPAPPVAVTVTVGLKPQTVTFPDFRFGMVRYDYAPAAIASSGLPVRFVVRAAWPDGSCTVSPDGLRLTYVHQGVCLIWAVQDGNAEYAPAVAANAIFVFPYTQEITFTAPPESADAGTSAELVATTNASRTVQFSVDPASSPAGTCAVDGATVTYLHPGTCVIAADEPGDADTSRAATVTRSVTVGKQLTATRIAIGPTTVTVTVVGGVDGGPTPTGTVDIDTASGTTTVPLVDAGAVIPLTLPTGGVRRVAATYSGDADYQGSSTLAARADPRLSARATSAAKPNTAGWYRTPVTVAFTCAITTAPLTTACPLPATLTRDTTGTRISRTVTATDGGAATTSTVVKLDRTAPTITVLGVRSGATYRSRPTFRARAADATSRVASLTQKLRAVKRKGVVTVTFTVRAVDRAGNVRLRTGLYRYR